MKAEAVKIQSLIWPVIFLIGGIMTVYFNAVNFTGGFQFLYITVPVLIIIGGYFLWFKRSYFGWIFVSLLLFFTTGILLSSLHVKEFNHYTQKLKLDPSPIGTITKVSHFPKMDRIQVRISNSHWWSPPHYFNINLLDKEHTMHQGQVIAISRPLSLIESSFIPYEFDGKKYWDLHNTSHDVFLYNSSDVQILSDSPSPFFERIRQRAIENIDHLYQNDAQAGILKALILGQKGSVSPQTKEVFKNAGLMHILAVSGLHVGIVCVLLFILLIPLKVIFPQSSIHYFLILIALWFYAGLTGMNTPVVRAVILMTFYLTAQRIDRQINKWNVFFWAVLLVLVIQPNTLFTVSFQLSFGAVASILMFYKKFYEWVKSFFGSNYFTGLVAVSLAAQIGIIPLLLFHFQEISLVSTLSSFFVIPLLFPLILITSISIVLPASWSGLSEGLALISSEILSLITDISDMLASWSFSSEVLVWSSLTMVLLLGAILLFGLNQENIFNKTLPWLKHAAFILVVLACVTEAYNIYRKRTHPVLVKYEYKNHSLTEIYFQGICYTNFQGKAPPFLLRNRKKYYANKMIIMSEVNDWYQLYEGLKQVAIESGDQIKTNLMIYDYIDNHEYAVDLSLSTKISLWGADYENQQMSDTVIKK